MHILGVPQVCIVLADYPDYIRHILTRVVFSYAMFPADTRQ